MYYLKQPCIIFFLTLKSQFQHRSDGTLNSNKAMATVSFRAPTKMTVLNLGVYKFNEMVQK